MIEGVAFDQIGLAGIASLAVVSIIRGWLVPRRTYEDVLHDRDEWKATARISETARQVVAEQMSELLEHARTTEAIIRAIPRAEVER